MDFNNVLDYDDLTSTANSNERSNFAPGKGEVYDIAFIICFIVIILTVLALIVVNLYHKIKGV